MRNIDTYKVMSLLSEVVTILSPDDNEAIATLVVECQKDGMKDDAILRQAVNLLATGVLYGNWPSVIAKMGPKR